MNQREMDVLNILWKSDKPMIATDIVNAEKSLTQSTVTAVLRKLLREKKVEVTGVTHSGKVLSRIYKPTEESRISLINHFVDQYKRFQHVIPLDELCAAIKASDN